MFNMYCYFVAISMFIMYYYFVAISMFISVKTLMSIMAIETGVKHLCT